MGINKVGLNLTALNDITPPNITVPSTPSDFMNNLPVIANNLTYNYFGLGTMIVLFVFLLWKIGTGFTELNENFTALRTVGIASGITSIIGIQMLALGYFTVYYHVVIFMGVLLVSVIWVFFEDKR